MSLITFHRRSFSSNAFFPPLPSSPGANVPSPTVAASPPSFDRKRGNLAAPSPPRRPSSVSAFHSSLNVFSNGRIMSSLNGTQAFSSRRLPFPQPALPPPAYPTLAPLRRGHHSAQISASSLSSFASSSTSSASSFESEVEAWEDAKSFMGAPSHRRNESWESQTSSDGGALRVGMEGYEEDLEGLGRGAVELLDRLEEESRAYRVRTSCSSDDTSALSTPHDL